MAAAFHDVGDCQRPAIILGPETCRIYPAEQAPSLILRLEHNTSGAILDFFKQTANIQLTPTAGEVARLYCRPVLR
jgi:hypothetical protein